MLALRLFSLISVTFFIFLSANLTIAQDSLRDRFLKERKKFIEFTVLDVAGTILFYAPDTQKVLYSETEIASRPGEIIEDSTTLQEISP